MISPLLANIYLHYVYDLWADQWRKREATGEVIVVRYADDTIVGFRREADAKRFLRDLRERLAKFGLALHPDKTRLIEFGRYAAQRRSARGEGKPETFDFLGFTHICREGEGKAEWFHSGAAHHRQADAKPKLVEIQRGAEPHAGHVHGARTGALDWGRWCGAYLARTTPLPTNSRKIASFQYHFCSVALATRALAPKPRRPTYSGRGWRKSTATLGVLPARIEPSLAAGRPFLVKHPRWEPSALVAPTRIYFRGAQD